MAGPHIPGTAKFQTNPLLPTRRLKPQKKKTRPRLTNFAPSAADSVDSGASPEVEALRVISVNRQPKGKGKEAAKPEVKPAASTSTIPAKYHTQTPKAIALKPAPTRQADVIDLTADSPKLAPMKPAAPQTQSSVPPATPLPPIRPPARNSTSTVTTFQQQTWSVTPSGHINLPEPRQSHSAGYHRQHQGPRYKVLPAGFGGLELARGHFGRSRQRGRENGGQREEKVKKDMVYTLKRHVEEYWRSG
ncbi:hypothetical protein M409DRAFT_23292 [Zasmidium cellare ATCC 36951]|uniref:Uncharacterized protein n=1 Tax=Zasmidium cellare ATCC 36951 TaxID=1080233 RepID=A0A6A6CI13_ZASCE|nr:uncharacterized protein M409DRAFT_23292 [Zasmidium cellare ATCC 36951]KAF2166661.1 hypothetical protein M409DRAFT_23292 [Zasmidium cellare ATCC 36951]